MSLFWIVVEIFSFQTVLWCYAKCMMLYINKVLYVTNVPGHL